MSNRKWEINKEGRVTFAKSPNEWMPKPHSRGNNVDLTLFRGGKRVHTDVLTLASARDRKRFLNDAGKGVSEREEKELHMLVSIVDAEREAWLASAGPRPQGKSTVMALVDCAKDIELVRTPSPETFASVLVDDHREFYALKSKSFENWLTMRYYSAHKNAPTANAMGEAIALFEARAMNEGRVADVHLRIAQQGDLLYLDLANEKWEVVEISPQGHRVLPVSPVYFRRARGMLPLPRPGQGGRLEDLRRFVNAPDERTWRLLCSWLLCAFHPSGPYPILMLYGEQGSAKSTTTRILRHMVDPNESPLRARSRNVLESMIAAKNSWCLTLDNLSSVNDEFSDALCRLSTGGGLSIRELYTNDDEVLFNCRRPIIMNGIEELGSRNDLLERSLVVNLPKIADADRTEEHKLLSAFERQRPKLLGALCDVLVGVLQDRPKVQDQPVPRMADAARWIFAAERTLKWPRGSAGTLLAENQRDAYSRSLEESVVGQAIVAFAEKNPSWSGSATDMLKRLSDPTFSNPLDQRRTNNWPANGKALSDHLRRLAPSLRMVGVEFTFERTRTARIIYLTRKT